MGHTTDELVRELRAISVRLEELAGSLDAGELSEPDEQTSTEQPAPAKSEQTPAAAEVSYDDVKAAVIEAAKVDRNKAVEVLQQFGASKAPELKETDYAAVVQELKELSDG